jgi:hypothetical protein
MHQQNLNIVESLRIAVLISKSKNAVSFLLLLISALQWNRRKVQNRFYLEGKEEGGKRVGAGEGRRNDPNNACTCE